MGVKEACQGSVKMYSKDVRKTIFSPAINLLLYKLHGSSNWKVFFDSHDEWTKPLIIVRFLGLCRLSVNDDHRVTNKCRSVWELSWSPRLGQEAPLRMFCVGAVGHQVLRKTHLARWGPSMVQSHNILFLLVWDNDTIHHVVMKVGLPRYLGPLHDRVSQPKGMHIKSKDSSLLFSFRQLE